MILHRASKFLSTVLLIHIYSFPNSTILTNAFVNPITTHTPLYRNNNRLFDSSTQHYLSTNPSENDPNEMNTKTDIPTVKDETQKLLEKAAQLRAEIAKLENKSVEQVTQEAKDKKEELQLRQQKQKEKLQQEQISSSLKSNNTPENNGRFVYVPETIEEQIRQAQSAIERAFQDGITRQTVRLALLKENTVVSTNPEEWPGGAQQMYREAGRPLTEALLKEVCAITDLPGGGENKEENEIKMRNVGGMRFSAPNVTSQDIWDFDGSGIVTSEAPEGSHGDVQAMVFPNTDVKYLNDIQTIDKAMGKRLFLLINPFWRNVDSWGFNILAPNAKQKAQQIVFDKGYDETYVLQRYSARGEQCVALKVYPYDWQLFAYKEEPSYGYNGNMGMVETALRLGSSKEEPNSAMFTELLNQREEFKYSRTMRQMKNMF